MNVKCPPCHMVIESSEEAVARWETHGYSTNSRRKYKKYMGLCKNCGRKKFYPIGRSDTEEGLSNQFSLKAKLAELDKKPV